MFACLPFLGPHGLLCIEFTLQCTNHTCTQAANFKRTRKKYNRNDYSAVGFLAVHVRDEYNWGFMRLLAFDTSVTDLFYARIKNSLSQIRCLSRDPLIPILKKWIRWKQDNSTQFILFCWGVSVGSMEKAKSMSCNSLDAFHACSANSFFVCKTFWGNHKPQVSQHNSTSFVNVANILVSRDRPKKLHSYITLRQTSDSVSAYEQYTHHKLPNNTHHGRCECWLCFKLKEDRSVRFLLFLLL